MPKATRNMRLIQPGNFAEAEDKEKGAMIQILGTLSDAVHSLTRSHSIKQKLTDSLQSNSVSATIKVLQLESLKFIVP